MVSKFESKHGIVSRAPEELYMSFVDMRNFTQMLPEDKKAMVTADYDSPSATVQGFTIGVKVSKREPYSMIELVDNGAPFGFCVTLHFDRAEYPGQTDFSIVIEAELNLMMKMMLGSKITEALNKVVDSLVDVSEGRMPKDMPSDFKF